MRYLIYTILFVITISSCDVIDGEVLENPIVENPGDTTVDTTSSDIPDFTKNILVMEFTGHKCGNCPKLAWQFSNLKKTASYKDRLVLMSIHAGSLASTQPAATGKYYTRFTTSLGDGLNNSLEIDGIVPKCVIDQKEYNGVIQLDFENGKLAIEEIAQDSSTFAAMLPSINFGSDSSISLTVNSYFNSTVDVDLNLAVYITEDSVIDWQKNYAGLGNPDYPSPDVENYVHMHVLRGAMNGQFGQLLNPSQGDPIVESKLSTTVQYTNKNIRNYHHANIVAFIYSPENDREVIQVEEWHLKDFID